MPVRSSNSSVRRWPGREEVLDGARVWAEEVMAASPEVTAVGVFGSYGRGDAGYGSDLDVVVVVRESNEPFIRRSLRWPSERLPLPADVLTYTQDEWTRLAERSPRFARALARDTVWLAGRPLPAPQAPGCIKDQP